MNKTVIVTGGSGFIFSHMCEMLLERGYRIINIDKLTYAARKDFKPKSKNYSFINADIKDIKELPFCHYIVNAAACSHVDRSIEKNDEFVESNILGTHNLLEILRMQKLEHFNKGWEYQYPVFVQISTDEVLGNCAEGFYKENQIHDPRNPYSCTKSASEMLVKAWGETYGIPYRITRTTNNYGQFQHNEKILPHCITSLLNGKKIKVHGDGSYVRNFIYVLDNCEAILSIIEKGKNGETYHISSNEEYSVLQIVEKVCKKFNKNMEDVVDFVNNRLSQDVRYGLDSSKIQKELNWKQKYKMDDVLDCIIESYKK